MKNCLNNRPDDKLLVYVQKKRYYTEDTNWIGLVIPRNSHRTKNSRPITGKMKGWNSIRRTTKGPRLNHVQN